MKKPSLYPERFDGCFLCGNPNVEQHHIYPSSRRPISDREGCTVWLCHEHHQGRYGVHSGDRTFDMWLKADCQRRWEERERKRDNHESFIRIFGRNYLEEE